MLKIATFSVFFVAYAVYSLVVYTRGTGHNISLSDTERAHVNEGRRLFQKHNCIACHQIYGLGGYLGPELTTAWSDPARGENYMRVFLVAGGQRMPNYRFSPEEVSAIISFLKYVDATAVTYRNP